MPETTRQAVKIFYDQDGQPSEVLMSYKLFERIEELLQRATENRLQDYFWSESWQSRIQQGEDDIKAGRVYETTIASIDSALEWLDE